MSRLYLDYAATTPVSSAVLEKMIPYFSKDFGNASSLYREGQIARTAIDDARLTIGKILDCNLDEIIFTSGATESNNLAIKGVIESFTQKFPEKTPEIISSPIEHSSVKNVLEDLEEKQVIKVLWCEVDSKGIVSVENVKDLITENTALITIMAVNNEIGSIQPLSRIGRMCEKNKILFHVDAVQAFGHIKTSPLYWKCDLLSLSAHKIYGPKGIGLLYVKHGTEMCEQMLGGGQERHYRSGTENISGIVGMEKAIEEAEEMRDAEYNRLKNLQKKGKFFLETSFSGKAEYKWNGPDCADENTRVVNNLHFSLPEIDGESLLMRLDLEGISLSLGSACSAGMTNPSHVLKAIGCTPEESTTGIRLTMGRDTTEEIFLSALKKIVDISLELKNSQGFFD